MEHQLIDIIKTFKTLITLVQDLNDDTHILINEKNKFKQMLFNSELFNDEINVKDVNQELFTEQIKQTAQLFGDEKIIDIKDMDTKTFDNFGNGLASLFRMNNSPTQPTQPTTVSVESLNIKNENKNENNSFSYNIKKK
jgi:hypothetical protein